MSQSLPCVRHVCPDVVGNFALRRDLRMTARGKDMKQQAR
jgi:hypothetical protein